MTVPDGLAGILAAIEGFLRRCRKPALIEPGQEPILLETGRYGVECRAGQVRIEAWDQTRNLTRRVLGVEFHNAARLDLVVEKFPKRTGRLTLTDLGNPAGQVLERRGARAVLREQFRRFLRRQFPDWTLSELSSEPDLAHSLSPSYPRALLRQGGRGWAALAAGPRAGEAAGALTFGLIWLD